MQEEEFCAEAFEEDPARKSSDVQTGCFIRFSNRRSQCLIKLTQLAFSQVDARCKKAEKEEDHSRGTALPPPPWEEEGCADGSRKATQTRAPKELTGRLPQQ
jgi:hypothetical protein